MQKKLIKKSDNNLKRKRINAYKRDEFPPVKKKQEKTKIKLISKKEKDFKVISSVILANPLKL